MTGNQLDLAELVDLIEGPVDQLRSSVEENDYSQEELHQLLEAEKSHGNRKDAVEFLHAVLGIEKSHRDSSENRIGVLEYLKEQDRLVLDVNGVRFELPEAPSLKLGGRTFVPSPEDEDIVEDVRRVEEGEKSRHEMVEALEEFGVPDRRLADMGNSEIRELHQKVSRFEQLKQELAEFFENGAENAAERQSREPGPLQEQDGQQERDGERREREENLEQHGYSGEELKAKTDEELRDLERKVEDIERLGQKLQEDLDEEISESTLEELDELAGKLERRAELEQQLREYGYTPGKLEDMAVEEMEQQLEELQEKQELVEEIDIDMDKPELVEIELEELQQIKQEKDEREELIEKLKQEGLMEEELRSSSTEDLRRLAEEMGGDRTGDILEGEPETVIERIRRQEDVDYSELLEKERQGEDREEVEEFLRQRIEQEKEDYVEEAEEDLEMLKGAHPHSDDGEEEEERRQAFQGLEGIQEKLSQLWNRNTREEEHERARDEKILKLLQDYRELGHQEQAVKTAHVLKAFLEDVLKVERELTYGELASELETEGEQRQELATLREFFHAMNREQYMGKITVDMERVMKAAEETVRRLS